MEMATKNPSKKNEKMPNPKAKSKKSNLDEVKESLLIPSIPPKINTNYQRLELQARTKNYGPSHCREAKYCSFYCQMSMQR